MNTLNIALDRAASAYKAARVGGETAIIETPVGVGSVDLGLLSKDMLRRRTRRPERPLHVRWNGNAGYLVGNLSDYAAGTQRFDWQHLIEDHDEARALTYAALGLLLGEGQHAINLLIGLPVPLMLREDARQLVRSLRNWLHDLHTFTIDHDLVSIAIDKVQAMPQPAGAFFAWGLDDEGAWQRTADDLRATVAVCDIGFNTLDLFTLREGRVVGRFTGGDTLGMRRAAEMLVETVRRRYDVDIDLYQADRLLRDKSPRLETVDGWEDLTGDADQARGQAASRILSEIERSWGNGRQFRHVLFTGGGAEALRGPLTTAYPAGVVLPDPVTANAVGLARYAQRLWA
jgi:hypothetical protein